MGAYDTLAQANCRGNNEIPSFDLFTANYLLRGGHCMVGSLTGAVTSQKVTEAR